MQVMLFVHNGCLGGVSNQLCYVQGMGLHLYVDFVLCLGGAARCGEHAAIEPVVVGHGG